MLFELCVGNYATHDGPLNDVDGIFQGSIKVLNSEEIIYGYYLIIPNVFNSQEYKMHICMNMKYILHGRTPI